jgi:hypothetical protein
LHVAIPGTFTKENAMSKKTAKAIPAKETAGSKFSRVVAKGKDFGKNVAERAKVAGASVKAAGAKAASHISRNKAAYIAGGLGAVAGAAGTAALSRKKQAQGEN